MPRRTARIGGRIVHAWGIAAYAKCAGRQIQKTFPLGTSEDVINRWALEQRERLKATKPASGTLAGDVARFLALERIPAGRRENLQPWLNVWAQSPLGQRSRSTITRADVLDVLDGARQSADRSGTKGTRYSGSSLRHIRQKLITLYRELDGPEHTCPARTVGQAPLNAPRQGFFETDALERVLSHLPEHYADVVRFAAFSGWRRAEIQGLLWSEVDEAVKVIRLSPERSKTRDGRLLPIIGPVKTVIERRAAYRDHSPLVFTRHVRERGVYVPVGDWRKEWAKATCAAGCRGALLHDLRRTVVRNLTRAGVTERLAMNWTGHKTRSVFDRYNIVGERDLHEAGAKLAAYVGGKL